MLIMIAAALLAGEAVPAAAPPAAVPAAAPKLSLQAQFDAATAAQEAGRYDEAVAGFAALEQLPSVRKNALVLSTVLMRKGASLIELGRVDEAEAAFIAGLRIAPSDKPELRNDRFLAEQSLGVIAMNRLDYAAAAARFRQSLDLAADPVGKATALMGLARATTFDPGDDSIHYADQAIEIAMALPVKDKQGKRSLADLQTIRARTMLNHGRIEDAYSILRKAVSEEGGLDLHVNASEIITRSDLAIAALLSGDREGARKYLAYTGAGRIAEAPFKSAARLVSPPCGGPANLQPNDVAVIEFSINPDGSVEGARPIYASVNGPAALEFARTVSGWSWRPGDVAKIPPLFRAVTRVELRCSTSAARPALGQFLFGELEDWLAKSHVDPVPAAANDAAALRLLPAELAKREATGNGVSAIPILRRLAENPIVTPEQTIAWRTRARDLALTAGAPLGAETALEIELVYGRQQWSRAGTEDYRAALRTLLVRPGVGDSAVVSDTLKIMIADPLYLLPAPSDASNLLKAVADDTRLSPRHQLRIAALVRLAAIQAASGDPAGAAASYEQTGLQAHQCSLLDSAPVLLRSNATSSDFPMEALSWGFEGWVKTEYDILPDGKTAAQRAIVAYPPFVFRDAAIGVTKGIAYAKSYRPDGSAGCGGAHQSIDFVIPSNHGPSATRSADHRRPARDR